jgi:hypothetical protein
MGVRGGGATLINEINLILSTADYKDPSPDP